MLTTCWHHVTSVSPTPPLPDVGTLLNHLRALQTGWLFPPRFSSTYLLKIVPLLHSRNTVMTFGEFNIKILKFNWSRVNIHISFQLVFIYPSRLISRKTRIFQPHFQHTHCIFYASKKLCHFSIYYIILFPFMEYLKLKIHFSSSGPFCNSLR